MKQVILLLFFLVVAGCASSPQQRSFVNFWVKAGVNYEDAVTVEAECAHDAVTKAVASAQDINIASIETKLVQTCMKAQGFRWGQYEQ